ncbi:hypothetical protein [Absidia glauca]|uniref:Uncharacterized protein n=1 Tax=Absidia glauca TaxID=4829 RepID=A0A163IRQ4_ABSGL|nr:hypothetical protein [Absidia glauca]
MKNLKTAFTSDIRQWSSRRHRHRHRYRRRHRRSESKVERKLDDVKRSCYSRWQRGEQDAEKRSLTVCSSSFVFRRGRRCS